MNVPITYSDYELIRNILIETT